VGLLNAVGILVLATLLHRVLAVRGRIMAFVGVLCWVGESFFYALNQVATNGLARLASGLRDADGSGDVGASPDLSLARFLLTDVHRYCGTILMFFYCAGGILFHSLFFTPRFLPRWISGYGLVAASIGLVGACVELLGHPLGLIPYLTIGPFEIIIGVRLLARGIRSTATVPQPAG
jgi:hypothetical protein